MVFKCQKNHIIDFFQNLFKVDSSLVSNIQWIKLVIPVEVSNAENIDLVCRPSNEEIRDTIYHIDAHGAPSPDGFTGIFYKTY